jgi:hypothetical protein
VSCGSQTSIGAAIVDAEGNPTVAKSEESMMSTKKSETFLLAQELLETSERLAQEVKDYRVDLELELEQEKAKEEAYLHLIRAIEHMLPRVNQLETLITEQVIPAASGFKEGEAHR